MVKIRFFGALRPFADDDGFFRFELRSDAPLKAGALKALLLDEVKARGFKLESALLLESVIADEESILQDDDLLPGLEGLAVLPPVCGG
jgi:molybdopterin converting factor small subunit